MTRESETSSRRAADREAAGWERRSSFFRPGPRPHGVCRRRAVAALPARFFKRRGVAAVTSFAGPDRIFVELDALRACPTEDHGAEPAVADRQRLIPARWPDWRYRSTIARLSGVAGPAGSSPHAAMDIPRTRATMPTAEMYATARAIRHSPCPRLSGDPCDGMRARDPLVLSVIFACRPSSVNTHPSRETLAFARPMR